jgi:hypothetical protein
MAPSLEQEILDHLRKLEPEQQARVLTFVRTLSGTLPKGVPGRELLRFAGVIDKEDADAMRKAIEEGCERIDANEW